MARGRAGTLAPHPFGLPPGPGDVPRRPAGPWDRPGDVRRRGGPSRSAAADPRCVVRGPGALEHPWLSPLPGRGGRAGGRPHPRSALHLADGPAAEGAERGGDGAAARARWSAPVRSSCETGRCSRCSTAPGPASARSSASTSVTSPAPWRVPTCRCSGCSGRATRSGWFLLGASPARPWPIGSPVEGRPLLEPKKWRRRSDAEAVFLNARGGRLTRVGRVRRGQEVRGPRRPRGEGQPPCPAALLRHPHAGSWGRCAGRPGAPGPRLHRHDPALHEGLGRAPPPGLRGRPPASGNHGGEGPRSMSPCRTRPQRRRPPTSISPPSCARSRPGCRPS